MIQDIKISGVNYEVNDSTRKYILKKIVKLDKYLPRHARKSVRSEVKIHQINADHGNKYRVDIQMFVPEKDIISSETGGNVMAVIDVLDRKIINQFKKYKESAIPHIGKRGILSKLRRG